MSTPSLKHSYRHRENLDGTWDSICMRCYATAAHTHDAELLDTAEAGHECDEASWFFLRVMESATASEAPVFANSVALGRACTPSSVPRFSRAPERLQRTPPLRLDGRPAGLREQATSEQRRSA